MKTFLVKLLTLMLVVSTALCIGTACKKDEEHGKEYKYKIEFIVDGKKYQTLESDDLSELETFENPTKKGFEFDGWYFDNNKWENPLTIENLIDATEKTKIKLYAKWTESHTHTYDSVTVGSKCTEKGVITYTCPCGNVYFEYLDVLGHEFKTYLPNGDATCDNDGTKTATCEREGCNETDTIVDENSRLGHEFKSEYVKNEIYHWRECERANCQEKGNYAEHTYEWEIDLESTVTEEGIKHEECVCGQIRNENTIIEKLPHNHVWGTYVSDNNATCTTDGTKSTTCTVSGCEETDTIVDENSRLGHEFKTYVSDNNATFEADGTKTATCEREGCNETDTIVDEGSKIEPSAIEFNTLLVEGTNVTGKVDNDVETFNFKNEITAKGNAKYVVALKQNGTNQVLTKIADLNVGDNIIYVLFMINDEVEEIYTVTIRRLPTYNVTFVTGNNSVVPSQTVQEGNLATKPNDLEKVGYTFSGWNYDFEVPITKNETITAVWTPNTDTLYTIQYYLENLENNEYTLTETVTKQGTTDTFAYAEIKKFEGFTAERNSVGGIVVASGNLVLDVYYQRNEYTVTLSALNDKGSVQGGGKYKYGKEVFVGATPYLAYDCTGWYDGGNKISENSNCSIIVQDNVNLIAEFSEKQEMNAFIYTSTLTTCVIEGVKNKDITEVVIPNYVTALGEKAFSYCSKLKSVIIPNSVNQIGKSVFEYCSSLTTATLPENITIIPASLFRRCSSLKNITIPNGVTKIENAAFVFCSNLTSITIPKSVKHIGINAFYSCANLVKIDYVGSTNDWVEIKFEAPTSSEIGALPFYHNKADLYIDNELVTCAEITTATTISDYAFYGYDKLTSVIISEKVTSIGESSFVGCPIENATMPIWCIDYISKDVLNTLEIQGGETIKSSEFSDCTTLMSVTIGNSVSTIECGAFRGCTNLSNVSFGNGLKTLEWDAFADCKSLINVELPNGLEKIEYTAFTGCSNLTTITIPQSVNHIGDSCFDNCHNLEKVNYLGSIDDWVSIYFWYAMVGGDGFPLNNYENENVGLYINDELVTIAKITTAESISQYAFYGYKKLTSVEIGDSVKSIGRSAFVGCSSLTDVQLPNSLKTIDEDAFASCSSIEEIIIPDSVVSIREGAYTACVNLKRVTIGNSVESIGEDAFSDCYNLVEVINKSPYITITKRSESNGCVGYYATTIINALECLEYELNEDGQGYTLTGIGDYKYTNLVIPSTYKNLPVTGIGSNAFYECVQLTNIVIPETITSIGNNAFSGCTGLTSLDVPYSVKTIGSGALSGCSSLTDLNVPLIRFGGYVPVGFLFSWTKSYNISPTGMGYDYTKYEEVGDWYACYNFSIPASLKNITFKCSTYFDYPYADPFVDDAYCAGYRNSISIEIPYGTTNIKSNSFDYYGGIYNIIIPNTVKVIGYGVFETCSVENVYFNGTIEEWKNIVKDDGWNIEVKTTYVICVDGNIEI